MSFSSLLIHDVIVSNPVTGSADRYGNDVPTATTVTEKMRVEPEAAEEHIIDRDTRKTRFRCFALPTTAMTGLSTLTWNGRTLRVDGEPKPFYGRVSLHHYEAAAEEILG